MKVPNRRYFSNKLFSIYLFSFTFWIGALVFRSFIQLYIRNKWTNGDPLCITFKWLHRGTMKVQSTTLLSIFFLIEAVHSFFSSCAFNLLCCNGFQDQPFCALLIGMDTDITVYGSIVAYPLFSSNWTLTSTFHMILKSKIVFWKQSALQLQFYTGTQWWRKIVCHTLLHIYLT